MNPSAAVNILAFANCEVLNEQGHKVKIASIWRDHTIVFIFLRHFGCVSCRAHAVQVWADRAKYEVNGAKIVFVGNGPPLFINFFKQDLKIEDATIYTDPSLESFRAVGFKRGFLVALGIRSIANGLRLHWHGHKQGSYTNATGDLWQLGGVVVVKPSGKVAYHYISLATGDFPPENDVAEGTR